MSEQTTRDLRDDEVAPLPPAPDRTDRRLRWAGEILVTIGVVLVLFVVYEVWVTNWMTADRQQTASEELARSWVGAPTAAAPVATAAPEEGTPTARLTIPSLGAGHSWVVVEGTSQDDLRTGPGHYTGSAQPGLPGNFAVAGHRVGRGAPFNDLGELESCAPLVVETAQGWAVYRVLPHADEAATWATGRGRAPQCRGLAPIDGVPGEEIVTPRDVGVIAAVPNRPGAAPAGSLITLTTCHPKFSARQRLVVHGVLDRFVPRVPGGGAPAELAN
ncbi:LPXTG-site transpeptidase (sortase) family protein [Actinomycetospora succinea]|uniref:LPXTG-site transpeptidase (Sortase) family protein n=1 Tax=Actinomycetospora succinea TaxID=663603 RepID=A0A4V3D9S8_9PSEU|nr:class E sortase [Actinomycetospora succinea]TDQ58582.1 LPXTG-site transpeptidase (sortase) family protein [Actinomycetospora succinea]